VGSGGVGVENFCRLDDVSTARKIAQVLIKAVELQVGQLLTGVAGPEAALLRGIGAFVLSWLKPHALKEKRAHRSLT
jgi:hypothetical protein